MTINDMIIALQGFIELDISADTPIVCHNEAGDLVPVLTVAYEKDEVEIIGS